MNSQDIITFKQKTIKILHDKEVLNIFNDENLNAVLKLLRKKPMTVDEIENYLKKKGIEKSDKTIYRYLSKLIKHKLVAKGGKRLTSKDEEILTNETIYVRSAKAFLFAPSLIQIEEDEKKYDKKDFKLYEITRKMVSQLFDKKSGSEKCFNNLLDKINRERDILTAKLFDNADQETLDLLEGLEWAELNALYNFAGWIAVCATNNLHEQIKICYSKE